MERTNIKTFSDLQRTTIKFLSGEYKENPIDNTTMLEKETVDILPQLLEINRKGLVTLDSQPGKQGIIEKTNEPFEAGDKYVQRAYVTGLMLTKDVSTFIKKLLRTDVVIVYEEQLNSKIIVHGDSSKMKVNYENSIGLTKTFKKNGKVLYTSEFPVPNPMGQTTILSVNSKSFQNYLRKNCTYLFISLKKEIDNSLFDIIIDCLPKSKLKSSSIRKSRVNKPKKSRSVHINKNRRKSR